MKLLSRRRWIIICSFGAFLSCVRCSTLRPPPLENSTHLGVDSHDEDGKPRREIDNNSKRKLRMETLYSNEAPPNFIYLVSLEGSGVEIVTPFLTALANACSHTVRLQNAELREAMNQENAIWVAKILHDLVILNRVAINKEDDALDAPGSHHLFHREDNSLDSGPIVIENGVFPIENNCRECPENALKTNSQYDLENLFCSILVNPNFYVHRKFLFLHRDLFDAVTAVYPGHIDAINRDGGSLEHHAEVLRRFLHFLYSEFHRIENVEPGSWKQLDYEWFVELFHPQDTQTAQLSPGETAEGSYSSEQLQKCCGFMAAMRVYLEWQYRSGYSDESVCETLLQDASLRDKLSEVSARVPIESEMEEERLRKFVKHVKNRSPIPSLLMMRDALDTDLEVSAQFDENTLVLSNSTQRESAADVRDGDSPRTMKPHISPNLELCWGNEHVLGQWMPTRAPEIRDPFLGVVSNESSLRKAYVCCGWDNDLFLEHQEECGTHSTGGKDGAFRGSTEYATQVGGHACSCDKQQGPYTVNPRERYEWVPAKCSLLPWDSHLFCALLGERTMVLVGDSTMQQTGASLASMITVNGGKCADQIVLSRSDFLVYGSYGSRNSVRKTVESFEADIAVITMGAHFHEELDVRNLWEGEYGLFNHLKDLKLDRPGLKIVWKTQNPGHVACGNFKEPVLKYTPGEESQDIYQWNLHPKFDKISLEFAEKLDLAVLDASALYLRPDAHALGDCLHYCLPGPIDLLAVLLQQMLFNGEI